MLEFRLLGPLSLGDGPGGPVGAGKQAALLAYLLLHRNRAVSRTALIEALWGESPPVTAEHALDVHISRLRKKLSAVGADGSLETHRGGFRLDVPAEALDLDRFERLADEARRAVDPEDRLAAAELALSLWRGPALADVLGEAFARPESERLEDARLGVEVDRIEALLALGRQEEAIGPLQAAVSAHPLRESPHRLLMLALYRVGRQAHALEVYRGLHRRLRDELGLEPSAELRDLEAAMLNQEPQLTAPLRHGSRPPPTALDARPRRRVLVICFGLAAAGVVAAAALLLTREPPRLSHIDFNGIGAIDPRSGRIVSEVIPSARPGRLAIDRNVVWTANQSDDSVSRIDQSTERVIQTVAVGSSPSGIAIGGGAVWVANNFDDNVSRIDPRTNTVVQRIPVGHGPTAVAFGLGAVWVSNAGDRSISRLDPTTGHVTDTIPAGADGQGIALGAGSVWVVDQSSNSVTRIDPSSGKVVVTVRVGTGPVAAAYAFASIWVANSFDGTVSRINPETNVVVGTVDVGGAPLGIASVGGRLWTADGSAPRVIEIDPTTNRVAAHVEVGSTPVAIATNGAALWLSVQPAPANHRGGTLHMASPSGSLDSIDPALAFEPTSVGDALIMTNDGLVTFRRVGGSDGAQVVPDLARSIPEPEDGGTTWRFELRRGIRYSTGRPVRPADFRYALERVFKLRSNGAGLYSGIVGGSACVAKPAGCDLSRGVSTDAASSTVTFHLTAPDPTFLDKLALTFADALPAQTSPVHRASRPLPATGPYKIVDFRPHRGLTLVRNPYFRPWSSAAQPDGFPDRIVWNASMPVDVATTAVEEGRVDVMFRVPAPERLSEIATRYASQLHTHPYAAVHYVFMNTRLPPFDDVRVRRAVNYALDRAEIVRIHGGSQAAEATCQFIPPLVPGYRPYCPYTVGASGNGNWTAPDLVKARELIAASHTRGMRIVVWSQTIEPFRAEMEYVVRLLNRLGYRASLRLGGPNYFGQIGDPHNRAQIGGTGWIASYANPTDFITPQFRCSSPNPDSGSNNVSRFCDPATDALITKAEGIATSDAQAAGRLWSQIDRRLVDQAPYAPEYVPRAIDFVSRRVGNYQYSPQYGVLVDQLWTH